MADESAAPPPSPPDTLERGRCHMCGYEMRGLPGRGMCPECGAAYDRETVTRLRPWPTAFELCCRLGWPLLLLIAAWFIDLASGARGIALLIIGVPSLGIVALNSYLHVRAILKRSLPEHKRTRGPIAALRALGTVIAFLVIILTLAPFVALGACLIMVATN